MTASAEDRFIAGARAHGEHERGVAVINRAYARLHGALLDLGKTPDQGVAFLFSLLNNDNQSIATWAALFLLPHREDAAKAALRKVSKSGIPRLALSAEMTLHEWDAGRLMID